MLYPDRPYEESRRFLASVAAATCSPLQGFRQVGDGVALTFVITTFAGIDFAVTAAVQRAAGLWAGAVPATTTVRILHMAQTQGREGGT